MHMTDTAEIAPLRTMLKNVNVEYSAVLRTKAQESKLARLEGLKSQRLALMSHIAALRRRQSSEAVMTNGMLASEPRKDAIAGFASLEQREQRPNDRHVLQPG